MSRRQFLLVATLVGCTTAAPAEPLSKRFDIDFFRDVPSRNLECLATRSDGRLVAGPTLTEIADPAPADLLWCIEPTGDPARFLLGTGPDGKIVELTFKPDFTSYTTRDLARVDEPQVFAVKRLPDGSIVAGTSPKGALYLIRDGKPVARALLPVDSIFDLLALDAGTVLVATGNPGRIYRLDLRKFATVGLIADKPSDTKILADRGITMFGEVRDRNVRRLAAFADGRIAAGSAPKGNIYVFPAAGGAPVILQENRDAEVTDLLPQPNGDLYATVVFSATTGESRITPPAGRGGPGARERETPEGPPPPVQIDRFGGRSAVLWFPVGGFAETIASRNNAAFYRLGRFGDTLLISAGDTGELLGYDLAGRTSLTFAGSVSSQLNGLVPVGEATGKFLILRNNAPGLSLLDFRASGAREAETQRIDLGTPALLGALRLGRLRDVEPSALVLETRSSYGTDELEGWGPWTPLKLDADGGWRAENLRGRSAKLRIRIPAPPAGRHGGDAAANLEIDHASLYALPQNRRPQLQEFRVLSPGYGLVASVDQPTSPVTTIGQLLQGSQHEDEKRKNAFLNSQIVPQRGTRVVFWNVSDPDGDTVACTFSIRREDEAGWTDVIVDTHDTYAQFDTAHLPDGVYFTRLVALETAPRPASERLSQVFETDDLVIDHTPPEVLEATARRAGNSVIVTVHGRDALSLLDGIDVTFNNGVREGNEQPFDGIRDGREETFVLDVPLARVSNATSVEVTLYDASGNSAARRLTW